MIDLTCRLTDSITLKHPLILASGISGNSDSLMARAVLSGASAVTTKGITVKYRKGAANPVSTDWGGGLITNLGLTNPGPVSMNYMINAFRGLLAPREVPVFVNIYGETPEECAEITTKMLESNPDMIEIDLPTPEEQLSVEMTMAVREAAGSVPISVKLSPNCCNIAELAVEVVKAGANLISAINPIEGLLVDAYARRPFLSTGNGNLSGPALKPIALRCIAEIYQAVNVPIIGTGGIMTGLDMAEMIMAGATAVGIGSVLYYHGYSAFSDILREFEAFMQSEKFESVSQMTGIIWKEVQ